jgi:signal transduction histidine kinase
MRGYLGAVTAAQEDERKRLARELHDETIQDLIALKQRVQMARRKAAGDPAALDARLGELQDMLETTMGEVRRFSRALRPIYLEEAGLVAALEALARDATQQRPAVDALPQDVSHAALQHEVPSAPGEGAPQVAFVVQGESRRLAPEAELALYRIVQEALHNADRHAQASNVRVGVEFDGDVTIRVQDDGIGFQVPARMSDLAMAGHYGLMGMQERAQLVGAQLVVRSQPGQGTTIEVHWRPGGLSGS